MALGGEGCRACGSADTPVCGPAVVYEAIGVESVVATDEARFAFGVMCGILEGGDLEFAESPSEVMVVKSAGRDCKWCS